MKGDDELEMLLGEIPHATSSMNLHNIHKNTHLHHNNLVSDHGYGHAPCVTHDTNGHGHGMYDDGFLMLKYGCPASSSPVSGFSLKSDNGRSISDVGSLSPLSPTRFEELKPRSIPGNGFWLEANERHLVDDFSLSRDFSKMCISDEQKFVSLSQIGYQSRNRAKYGAFDDYYRKGFSDSRGFNLSVPRETINFEGVPDFGNYGMNPRFYSGNNDFQMGINRALFNGTNQIEARDSPNMVPRQRPIMPCYNQENSLQEEDSFIFQGENINYGTNKNARSWGPRDRKSFPSILPETRGYMYQMAKDQHGCRFLQRMFDEGTSRDVGIIYDGIIDNVVELTMNQFGNYLVQKLLEVCNEEQRTHLLLRVVEKPGELVRISLNTHGTRVVQKLVETLKTRQQILLVISALEPGFLALIKDLNGNHVVQSCLQCFSNEDSKFIFVAAAKYCVDIATHQHGCCVLQRCISHSNGEHRDNLIAKISANGLFLAQDPFGNYVVQFILELNIPYAISKLTSQFEGNYVHLSTQKFSSHVVEKCLAVCDDVARSKIIRELLSATYFDQLLQDPHANYVVQTALRVSEGPLHNSLVRAIESHKAISRNSPYSKRIFTHKLLKR